MHASSHLLIHPDNIYARTLILEEYPEQNMRFLEERGIKFLQFGIAGNKVRIRIGFHPVKILILHDRNPLYKVKCYSFLFICHN